MDIEILTQEFYNYSTYMRGYSSKTVDRYKKIINYFCKRYSITKLDQINKENVRALFLHGRIERSWRPNTFVCHYHSLTVFFDWCIQNKYLKDNPIEDIELPKIEKRLPERLSKQDIMKLLEITYNYPYDYKFLRYRNHAMFSMFVFAGLRKNELLHLKMTDVDIENLSIFVRQGKGNKDRIIPMSHTLAQTLKRYLNDRKRIGKTCSEFFVSLNRNVGYTENGLKRLVIQMKKASCIEFTIHKLRHSFATLMLEGGCDIYSLSRMMGHSDIKTTTIYLGTSAEHLRGQILKHPLNCH